VLVVQVDDPGGEQCPESHADRRTRELPGEDPAAVLRPGPAQDEHRLGRLRRSDPHAEQQHGGQEGGR